MSRGWKQVRGRTVHPPRESVSSAGQTAGAEALGTQAVPGAGLYTLDVDCARYLSQRPREAGSVVAMPV